MTDDPQGHDSQAHDSEGPPARPVSTRWSEDPVQEGDSIPRPYVPGRRSAATSRATDHSEAAEPLEPTGASEAPADEFPFDAFDINGDAGTATWSSAGSELEDGGWTPEELEAPGDTGGVDMELEPVDEAEPVLDAGYEDDRGGVEDASEEVADVLERLATLLRSGGEEAVRRELDSADRLTALLSGVLSGYLAAR